MKTVAERLLWARKEARLTQEQLAKRVGLSQTTISDLERGRNEGSRDLVQIAIKLDLNPRWLATGKGEQRPGATGGTNVAEQHGGVYEGPPVNQVPLISWVQAGEFEDVVDNFHPGEADEWVATTVPVMRHTYALRVNGESMTNPVGEPTFPHGAIIVIEPEAIAPLEDMVSQFIIVKRAKNGGEATFKQLVRDGGNFYLKPLNPQWPLIPVEEGDVCVGVVRERVTRFF